MENILNKNIQYLKGVGEKRAALYARLGIETIQDLLYHFPRQYIDFSKIFLIAKAPMGENCAIRAMVSYKSNEQRIRKGLSIFKVKAVDDSADVTITFFNAKYTVDHLKIGEEYIFYGKLTGSLLHREMSAPMIIQPKGEEHLSPVYALTAGLTSKMIATNMMQALQESKDALQETLPAVLRQRFLLESLSNAVWNMHFPTDLQALERAKKRLIFEELFYLSLAFAIVKEKRKVQNKKQMHPVDMEKFYDALPFALTSAQKRVIAQALRDMCSETTMNRLVQGDVGSGKTVVAAACAYFAAGNGFQTALMAPTEILAHQHFATLTKLLQPLGVTVGLLTGSMTAKEKRSVLDALKNGEIALCVGTHALLTDTVTFQNLALVITDEQHRFGVEQRLQLSKKGENPHVLVMSATPIPRTLALIVYGDLDVSLIDELPPGRKQIETYKINSKIRLRAYGFIEKQLKEGRQAYIVCPLVEEGEEPSALKSVVQYTKELQKIFKTYTVGFLHGQMPAKEKEAVMSNFYANNIDILVSTTVIEVGVDVPNANIMLIENAERFGLSQLHQLRGRIGRGNFTSYCILLSDVSSVYTKERLEYLCKTSDGFKIAEYDLKMRGPGDFFGVRQHGLPTLKVANMATDMELLYQANQSTQEMIRQDPTLQMAQHKAIAQKVKQMLERIV